MRWHKWPFFLKEKIKSSSSFSRVCQEQAPTIYSHSQWLLTLLTWLASLDGVAEGTCAVTWRAVTSLPSARQGTPLPTWGACPRVSWGPTRPWVFVALVLFSLWMEIKDVCILDTDAALAFRKPLLAGTEISFLMELCRVDILFFSSSKSEHRVENTGVLSFSYLPMCFPAPTHAVCRRDASSDRAGTD